MFGKKITDAEATIARLTAVIVAVGLTAEATPETAGAHVAKIKTDAAAEAAAPLSQRISALETQGAQLIAVREAFVEAGITIAGETLTKESVKAALDTKIATSAAKVIAGAGHEALALPAGTDAAASPAADMTQAELSAAIEKEKDARKRKDLYDTYKKRFLS